MMKFIVKYTILFVLAMTTIAFILYNKCLDKFSSFYMCKMDTLSNSNSDVEFFAETSTYFNISDVFIAVKTSYLNHKTRLKVILDTWISTCRNQTYIFTDADDLNLINAMPDGHVINTECGESHHMFDLACKLGKEIETFVCSGKKWFCHVDDDNYLNTDKLMHTLSKYYPAKRWYLGKPSLDHPWSVEYMKRPVKFWFGTGGAGFCLSGALRRDLWLHAGSKQLVKSSLETGVADDVVIGFVAYHYMEVHLTTVDLFHSHMENMTDLRDPLEQITLSYHDDNIVNVTGFDVKEDPSRYHFGSSKIFLKIIGSIIVQ